MDSSLTLDLMKIVLAGAFSGGIVRFLYQRKLERIKVYESTISRMHERMLKGIEEIIHDSKEIDTEVDKICSALREIENSEGNGVRNVGNLGDKFQFAINKFRGTIGAHRIYITPLIPFGDSSSIFGNSVTILGFLGLLKKDLEIGTAEKVEKDLERLWQALKEAKNQHVKLCHTVEEVKRRLINGEPVL